MSNRIPFGAEETDESGDRDDCYDCGVRIGEYHIPGCDTERCPKDECRNMNGQQGQSISCLCCNVEERARERAEEDAI